MASRVRPVVGRTGFTLVEILLVLAILGILSGMAVAGYQRFQARARRSQVIVDLKAISTALEAQEAQVGGLPPTLAPLGPEFAGKRDVWGNPYVYNRVATTPIGALRKDKFLVPINSDYDLFSVGEDGVTQPPLQSAPARDDIVRAGNGSFYGRAEHY